MDKEQIIEFLGKMSQFQNVNDIPDVPITDEETYKKYVVPNFIRCGAIPKKDLVVGKTYYGNCRNSNTAVWNGIEFEYIRYKFGTIYTDTINHFEDDDGYDLFVPISEVN